MKWYSITFQKYHTEVMGLWKLNRRLQHTSIVCRRLREEFGMKWTILDGLLSHPLISISWKIEMYHFATYWTFPSDCRCNVHNAMDINCWCNTLLKSDVTRRGPLSWIPGMLVHALSISLSISFATAQSSHNSEIYNIGVHAQ